MLHSAQSSADLFCLRLWLRVLACICYFFFFNDTATTEIYTLSLHDALPICRRSRRPACWGIGRARPGRRRGRHQWRSEEHTSELQSQSNLVCRLLLEKKKKKTRTRRPG